MQASGGDAARTLADGGRWPPPTPLRHQAVTRRRVQVRPASVLWKTPPQVKSLAYRVRPSLARPARYRRPAGRRCPGPGASRSVERRGRPVWQRRRRFSPAGRPGSVALREPGRDLRPTDAEVLAPVDAEGGGGQSQPGRAGVAATPCRTGAEGRLRQDARDWRCAAILRGSGQEGALLSTATSVTRGCRSSPPSTVCRRRHEPAGVVKR